MMMMRKKRIQDTINSSRKSSNNPVGEDKQAKSHLVDNRLHNSNSRRNHKDLAIKSHHISEEIDEEIMLLGLIRDRIYMIL